jgi:hypothetical protein
MNVTTDVADVDMVIERNRHHIVVNLYSPGPSPDGHSWDQDLAPCLPNKVDGLLALQRACLSTLLYKSNILW